MVNIILHSADCSKEEIDNCPHREAIEYTWEFEGEEQIAYSKPNLPKGIKVKPRKLNKAEATELMKRLKARKEKTHHKPFKGSVE